MEMPIIQIILIINLIVEFYVGQPWSNGKESRFVIEGLPVGIADQAPTPKLVHWFED